MVILGEDCLIDEKTLLKYVDKIDTQTVVLQSIFLADIKQGKQLCARTWGQYITGKYQDAIKRALTSFLGG